MRSLLGDFRGAVEVIVLPVVAIALVAAAVMFAQRRRGREAAHLLTVAGRAAVVIGVLAIVTATLLPVAAQPGYAGINLTPFASVRLFLAPGVDILLAVRNLAMNVLLFVPLGMGVVLWRRRGVLPAVAIGLVASLLIEALQWLLPLGRSVDVDDVLLNTVGTLLGAVAALAGHRRALRPRQVWVAERRPVETR